MSQRFAANQVLQNIFLESSDGECSNSESDKVNNVITDIQNEEKSSNSDDEYTNQEASTNTDDGARARSSCDNDEQTLLSKHGPHWRHLVPSQITAGRLEQHNIVRIRIGPTCFSTIPY